MSEDLNVEHAFPVGLVLIEQNQQFSEVAMHLTWILQQGMMLQAFHASDQVTEMCQLRVKFDQRGVERMVCADIPLKAVLNQQNIL